MKKKLKDIVEVRTGYQFRGKVAACDDANVVVIQIKDVDERLHLHTSDLVPVKVDKPEPYAVSQGDILFLTRGQRQYATIITEPITNTIATGYFLILRPKTKWVDAGFLAWSINQPEFQEALRPLMRGSHTPIISKADFQELTIQLPPLDIQKRITDLQTLFQQERDLTASLERKRGELLQAVSRKLIKGQLKSKEPRA